MSKTLDSIVVLIFGILAVSVISYPLAMFSYETTDFLREDNVLQNSLQNGFEPATDLHDYFMFTEEDGYWLDAKAHGNIVNMTGVNQYVSLFLDFNFSFYDSEFDHVYMSSNGYFSFVDNTPNYGSAPPFPSNNPEFAYCIAPFWSFMKVSDNIYWWSTEEFEVIQFDHMLYYLGDEAGTFQVVLYPNGTIDFNYLEMVLIKPSAVGLNYGDGEYFNSYPSDELDGISNFTIRFSYSISGADLEVRLTGPSYALIGTSYLYNLTVKNIGAPRETNLLLSIYIDDLLVNSTEIASLVSFETYTYVYNFTGNEVRVFYLTVTIEEVPDEYSYDNNVVQMPIIVSMERKYAIFQDRAPWGSTSIQTVLNKSGIPYDIFTSASIGVVDLSNYTRVIIPSSQPIGYRQAVYDNLSYFETFAINGGILEIHAADQGGEEWIDGRLPGNVYYTWSPQDYVDIVAPWHPVVNIPHTITDDELDEWSSSTHGYFTNYTIASQTILATPTDDPVLIETRFASGYIIYTSQTVEWAYMHEYSMFLENLLLYRPIIHEHELIVEIHAPEYVEPAADIRFELRVLNWGNVTETDIDVAILVNEEVIFGQNLPSLDADSDFHTFTFWTLVFPGEYEITATVTIKPNDANPENNVMNKFVTVRPVLGRILWDEGHSCYPADNFQILLNDFEERGYQISVTSDPLNETDLSVYAALICAEPAEIYSGSEVDAIQDFVWNGGGLFTIGDTYQEPLNNLTLFVGIEWLFVLGEDWGPTTNITQHPITDGVSEIYFSSPVSRFNLTSPAINLAYLETASLLAASWFGEGRVVAIADDNCLDNDDILESDNRRLGMNIITWLTEGHLYNQITDVHHEPTEITYEDEVEVICNITDSAGIDTVVLYYRVNAGSWQQATMSLVSGDTYSATIPSQSEGSAVEYYISVTNILNHTNNDNNDGEFYGYTVEIMTPTTSTTSPTTSTSTSTTAPTTPTTSTPPDNTMLLILIILGAGGAIAIIVIIVVYRKKTSG